MEGISKRSLLHQDRAEGRAKDRAKDRSSQRDVIPGLGAFGYEKFQALCDRGRT